MIGEELLRDAQVGARDDRPAIVGARRAASMAMVCAAPGTVST
jgi:hypothetical protein